MTIKEIAKLAGVSISTVSKVMNNKDDSISEETREHVLKIAKEYNYTPYSSVITPAGKSLTIGVIFRSSSEISMTVSGILERACDSGYSILLSESCNQASVEEKNISVLASKHVDGILWEPVYPLNEGSLRAMEDCGIPYLMINSAYRSAANINYEKLGYKATDMLIKNRHRDIACLLGCGTRTEAFLRGYKKCLFDNNIKLNEDLIIDGAEAFPMNKIACRKISGMVVSHYAEAIKIYEALNKLHYSTPYDVSMISLKDDTRVRSDYPPISTFTIPHREFGKKAVDYLIGIIEKKGAFEGSGSLEEFLDIETEPDNMYSIGAPYLSRYKKVLVVGSINMDNYLNFEELPHTGKTVSTSSAAIHPGGKCLNEGLGAAKLGHNAALIATLGNDSDADTIYDLIKDYPIDTIGIKRCQGMQTGQSYVFVQRDGESMISIMSGANSSLSPENIEANERLFQDAAFCLIQTEIPLETAISAALTAKKHGVRTVIKPSACAKLPKELLNSVDIIVPNLDELNEICPGTGTMEEKTKELIDCGIGTVIVTLGAAGCYIKSVEHNCECRLPAADFVSVDSTGAGDAFISGLVSYLLYGYDLVTSAKIATYAAGFSTTRQGTTTGLIDKDTLEAYIRQKEPELLS